MFPWELFVYKNLKGKARELGKDSMGANKTPDNIRMRNAAQLYSTIAAFVLGFLNPEA